MITVFTPTYNRAYIIEKLYESLLCQTNPDFEWLVVDDGSTDETEKLFGRFISENRIRIRYFKTLNGGKHRAINYGVKLAQGDLFFIVDSDDRLSAEAIEKLSIWKQEVSRIPNVSFCGVSGLKGYNEHDSVGTGIKSGAEYVDATAIERPKYGLKGDKAEAFFTHILKKYPFPEFEGENFITENAVWYAIALDGYKMRWYNQIIYYCDYLDDGLTKSGEKKYIDNPRGTLYSMHMDMKAYPKSIKTKLTRVSAYAKYFSAVKTNKVMAKELGVSLFFLRFSVLVRKTYDYLFGRKKHV